MGKGRLHVLFSVTLHRSQLGMEDLCVCGALGWEWGEQAPCTVHAIHTCKDCSARFAAAPDQAAERKPKVFITPGSFPESLQNISTQPGFVETWRCKPGEAEDVFQRFYKAAGVVTGDPGGLGILKEGRETYLSPFNFWCILSFEPCTCISYSNKRE